MERTNGESVIEVIERMDTLKKAQEEMIPGGGDCPELNPLDSMENNHKIPVDALAEVFSYLTHTEKLIARLVCTDWNREISSILATTSYFALTTVDGHEVILDSEVPWTKIKIHDSPRFLLPTNARSFVTTIVLEVPGSDMRESMRTLCTFPQLIDLDVSIVGGDLTKREDSLLTSEQLEVLSNRFRENAAKLKNLSITIPFGKFNTLLESLTGFFTETKSLIKLSFRQQRPNDSELSYRYVDNSQNCSLADVSNIISKSSRTLKHLELDFVSKIRKKLFTELISALTPLEDLKLESFLIHHSDPTDRKPESDFQIHQDFLKTQMAKGFMKSLSLPWCSNASLCQEFLQCLPENIEFLGNVCKEHMTEEFGSTLSKCETIAVHSLGSSICNQPCPSIRQFHYCVQEFVRAEYSEIYKNLGNSLTNVVEFYAGRYDESVFGDNDLRLMIENLQQLRILEIHCERSISDDSVCGTREGCALELKRKSQLHLNQNVPENMRDGLPLSSLKRLETLILVGTTVTDVGIYYGLQFGSTLKHMTFETDEKISDWGLHWLGTGNPSLESFDCSFKTGETSLDVTNNLRKQFPMIEITGKFKLVEI